jgi:hypothetical protein
MFFIGCNECPQVAQVACNDRIGAMIASLTHERDFHRGRWNDTKQAVLMFAIGWAQADIVEIREPEGMVC